MNLFTHLAFSKLIFQHVPTELSLDRSAFLYGNIKPDLTPDCIRKPHTLENYRDRVDELCRELTEGDSYLTNSAMSMKLGEICHYLCDFFCYYHKDETQYFQLKRHFFYETALHFRYLKLRLLSRSKCFLSHIKKELEQKETQGFLPSLITSRTLADYDLAEKTMLRDIEFAIKTALLFCHSVGEAYASRSLYLKPLGSGRLAG